MEGVTIEIKPAESEPESSEPETSEETASPETATVSDIAAVAHAAGIADGAIVANAERHQEENRESIEWLKLENERLSLLTSQMQGQIQTLTETQALQNQPPVLTESPLSTPSLEVETITVENPEASEPASVEEDRPASEPEPAKPKRKFRIL